MPNRIENIEVRMCKRCDYIGTNFTSSNRTLCRTCKNKAIIYAPLMNSLCKYCGYVGKDFPNGGRSRCSKCMSVYQKNRKVLKPLQTRLTEMKSHLKRLYGMSVDDYNILFNEQKGLCAICSFDPSTYSGPLTKVRTLHVDHNHETGVIRGLLCHPCNAGLGHFKEKAQNLYKAAKYLEGPIA